MKRLLSVLTTAALCLSSASALAKYDKFECVTNDSLQLSSLECVACGISKYYSDQGIDFQPSHRWLALLATVVREEKLTSKGGRGPVSDLDAKTVFLQKVINRVQAYGVCSEFTVKNIDSRSREMHDMSAKDWGVFMHFISKDTIPDEKHYDELAESLGFKSNRLLSVIGKNGPKASLDYLFENHEKDEVFLDDKRKQFKEKLNQALEPDYTISGDKKEKALDFIRSGDKGQGLRGCLAEIKERFFRKPLSDKETHKMCAVIANSCDIARGNSLTRKDDFCVLNGMGLRPASTTQPPPFGGNGGGRMPPPPRPATSGKGIN
ncbi:hypothetical protein AZI85_03190 [Bdellovibrio bacteriovorus]|uniref:Uncharacterized protein n=1 Tax=Bdellovibrio bacteriovorus TaxID=959 RepID=A0A150WKE3_BDEBC|nr:hypothetical protein [Bdellovibrio bacteriovorus]KYG64440.1 hypothetical protein AZI85_03190 [Bdellovibrio bacteriovorus]